MVSAWASVAVADTYPFWGSLMVSIAAIGLGRGVSCESWASDGVNSWRELCQSGRVEGLRSTIHPWITIVDYPVATGQCG